MLKLIIFLYAVLCTAIYSPERVLSASLSPYILVLLLLKQQCVVTHDTLVTRERKKKPCQANISTRYVYTTVW